MHTRRHWSLDKRLTARNRKDRRFQNADHAISNNSMLHHHRTLTSQSEVGAV